MATGAAVIVAAGATAYSAYQSRKDSKDARRDAQQQQDKLIEAQSQQMSEILGFTREQQEEVKRMARETTSAIQSGNYLGYTGGDIFGDRVPAALYNKINASQSQQDTVKGNIAALPSIGNLVSGANKIVDDDFMTRAHRFIPGFEKVQGNLGKAATDLSAGRLPYDDVLGIVSDRQELSNTLGIPGTNTNATLKDLGLSKLDAISKGGSLLAQMSDIAQSVAPVQSRINPSSQLFDPATRLQADINQSVLDQQSRQNANILNAAPDPTAAGLFALNTQTDFSNVGVPPIPSLYAPPINTPQSPTIASQVLPFIQAFAQIYGASQSGGSA